MFFHEAYERMLAGEIASFNGDNYRIIKELTTCGNDIVSTQKYLQQYSGHGDRFMTVSDDERVAVLGFEIFASDKWIVHESIPQFAEGDAPEERKTPPMEA